MKVLFIALAVLLAQPVMAEEKAVDAHKADAAPKVDAKKEEKAVKKAKKESKKEEKKSTKAEKRADGLVIEDIKVGDGAEAVKGKSVSAHYTGTLTNGKVFDSSLKGDPITFPLGAGRVIKGWDEGIVGMKVHGKRKLTIPPEMAYGNREVGGGLIPANSTLIFEVELTDVK